MKRGDIVARSGPVGGHLYRMDDDNFLRPMNMRIEPGGVALVISVNRADPAGVMVRVIYDGAVGWCAALDLVVFRAERLARKNETR